MQVPEAHAAVASAGARTAYGGRLGTPVQIVHPALFPAVHLGRAQGADGRDVFWVRLGPSWLRIQDLCAIATHTSQPLPC